MLSEPFDFTEILVKLLSEKVSSSTVNRGYLSKIVALRWEREFGPGLLNSSRSEQFKRMLLTMFQRTLTEKYNKRYIANDT